MRSAWVVLVVLVVGCASTGITLSNMTVEQLQRVDENELCEGHAQLLYSPALVVQERIHGRGNPNLVIAEVKRRGISCDWQRSLYQYDCSGLQVLAAYRVAQNAVQVTVKNNTKFRKTFWISSGGLSSYDNHISGGAVGSFVMASTPMIAAIGAARGGDNEAVSVHQCLNTSQQ